MPPKAKKKRAVAKFSVEAGPMELPPVDMAEKEIVTEPPMRQVVEVVEEDKVPDALEIIKENAQEIEDAVETIEEEVETTTVAAPSMASSTKTTLPDTHVYEDEQRSNDVVGSLFSKEPAGITPEITVVGKRDKTLGVWVGAMLGIALAVGVSLIVLVRGPQTFTSMLPKAKPTPTIAPTVAPTEAPVAVSRKDIQIKVINGGGVVGAGSKMKAFLEEKGYTVSDVGNADEYTYETTDIVVKAGKEAYGKMIADDLKVDYSLGSTSATLNESAAYDAEVIVGKE
jgi:hypothetical protein